jgi:hypothetical protein
MRLKDMEDNGHRGAICAHCSELGHFDISPEALSQLTEKQYIPKKFMNEFDKCKMTGNPTKKNFAGCMNHDKNRKTKVLSDDPKFWSWLFNSEVSV